MAKTLPPMHPGEVLREEFLIPMALSPYALAKICDVPRTRIERIVREEISVTADTALRLSKALGTTAGFWLSLQTQFGYRNRGKGDRQGAGENHPGFKGCGIEHLTSM